DEALEGDGNRELHAQTREQGHQSITEKSSIHPHFDQDTGQGLAHVLATGEDELLGTVGVMNVAGAMMDIKHLPGLSDRTEQGIVAALPLLLAIEAHCRAFSVAAGPDHRAIEVQSDAAKVEGDQTPLDLLAIQPSNLCDTAGIRGSEQAAHGGN